MAANTLSQKEYKALFGDEAPFDPSLQSLLPQSTRQMWVYEEFPSLIDSTLQSINESSVFLPSKLASPKYSPVLISPILSSSKLGSNPEEASKAFDSLIDSIYNGEEVSLTELDDLTLFSVIKYGLNKAVRRRPTVYPSVKKALLEIKSRLTPLIVSETQLDRNHFLLTLLIDSGFFYPKRIYDYALLMNNGTYDINFTQIFHWKRFSGYNSFINHDNLIDPRFLSGFGYTFLDDSLEDFINSYTDLKDNTFFYFSKPITLIQLSALFGSERIFNFLLLNGNHLNYYIIKYAISGRNSRIIKESINLINNLKEDSLRIVKCGCRTRNFSFVEYFIGIFPDFFNLELPWGHLGIIPKNESPNKYQNESDALVVFFAFFTLSEINKMNYEYFSSLNEVYKQFSENIMKWMEQYWSQKK